MDDAISAQPAWLFWGPMGKWSADCAANGPENP